jgi:hypothetical protein
VLATLRDAKHATVKELVPTVYDDVPTEKHWIAEASLWAHLQKLVDDGVVSSTDRDAEDATWTAA